MEPQGQAVRDDRSELQHIHHIGGETNGKTKWEQVEYGETTETFSDAVAPPPKDALFVLMPADRHEAAARWPAHFVTFHILAGWASPPVFFSFT